MILHEGLSIAALIEVRNGGGQLIRHVKTFDTETCEAEIYAKFQLGEGKLVDGTVIPAGWETAKFVHEGDTTSLIGKHTSTVVTFKCHLSGCKAYARGTEVVITEAMLTGEVDIKTIAKPIDFTGVSLSAYEGQNPEEPSQYVTANMGVMPSATMVSMIEGESRADYFERLKAFGFNELPELTHIQHVQKAFDEDKQFYLMVGNKNIDIFVRSIEFDKQTASIIVINNVALMDVSINELKWYGSSTHPLDHGDFDSTVMAEIYCQTIIEHFGGKVSREDHSYIYYGVEPEALRCAALLVNKLNYLRLGKW